MGVSWNMELGHAPHWQSCHVACMTFLGGKKTKNGYWNWTAGEREDTTPEQVGNTHMDLIWSFIWCFFNPGCKCALRFWWGETDEPVCFWYFTLTRTRSLPVPSRGWTTSVAQMWYFSYSSCKPAHHVDMYKYIKLMKPCLLRDKPICCWNLKGSYRFPWSFEIQ